MAFASTTHENSVLLSRQNYRAVDKSRDSHSDLNGALTVA
jgi:hypothetical protein